MVLDMSKTHIIFLFLLAHMIGCTFGGDLWKTLDSQLDSAAPSLVSITPNSGSDPLKADAMPPEQVFTLTFSKDLDAGTATTASVSITGSETPEYTLAVSGKTITITPVSSYKRSATYTIQLQPPLSDTLGNTVISQTATFTVSANPGITVQNPSAASTILPFNTISLTFSEPIDTASNTPVITAKDPAGNVMTAAIDPLTGWSNGNQTVSATFPSYISYATDSSDACTVQLTGFAGLDQIPVTAGTLTYTIHKPWENTGAGISDADSSGNGGHYCLVASSSSKKTYLVYLASDSTIKTFVYNGSSWSGFGEKISDLNTNIRNPSACVIHDAATKEDAVVIAYSSNDINSNIHIATVTSSGTSDQNTGFADGIGFILDVYGNKAYLAYCSVISSSTLYLKSTAIGSYTGTDWNDVGTAVSGFYGYDMNAKSGHPMLCYSDSTPKIITNLNDGSSGVSSIAPSGSVLCSAIRSAYYKDSSGIEQVFLGAVWGSSGIAFTIYKLSGSVWTKDLTSTSVSAGTSQGLMSCEAGNFASVISGGSQAQLHQRDSSGGWNPYQNLTTQDISMISPASAAATAVKVIASPHSDGIIAAYQTGNDIEVMKNYR